MTSTLTLNNASLDVTPINPFSPANVAATVPQLNGHIFFLITGATSIVGTFANQGAADPNLPGWNTLIGTDGQEYALSYQAKFSAGTFTGGHDVAIMAVSQPESLAMLPGSFGLA